MSHKKQRTVTRTVQQSPVFERDEVLFCISAATVSAASGTVTGAGAAAGTTDAFDSFFSGPANVENHQTQNHCNYGNDQKINGFHILISFRSEHILL